MLIKRISTLTGITRELDIPVTVEELFLWRVKGAHIQDAMPHLTADEREFLMTGVTPEEWHNAFGW